MMGKHSANRKIKTEGRVKNNSGIVTAKRRGESNLIHLNCKLKRFLSVFFAFFQN